MFDEIDKLLIKKVQEDIPLTLDPYGDIAKDVGCSRSEVLKRLKRLMYYGYIKRIVAILYHRTSGYSENGMFAAVVDPREIDRAGRILSAKPNVTHCYERKSYLNWPYNLYAMIHGKTKNDVEMVVEDFIQYIDVGEYQILYSLEEFKKTSIKYF